jgi:hypothetical protein
MSEETKPKVQRKPSVETLAKMMRKAANDFNIARQKLTENSVNPEYQINEHGILVVNSIKLTKSL